MQPLYFVVPTSHNKALPPHDIEIFLPMSSTPSNSSNSWQFASTVAVQNWRSLAITKLTQNTLMIRRLKNVPKPKLLLSVAAADLHIELFFNCRPH